MAVSYHRLWKLLIDRKMSKADLRKAAGLAPNTMTKLRRKKSAALWIQTLGILWNISGKILLNSKKRIGPFYSTILDI